MTTLTPPISDADLHGLVDGHLEPSRRVDVLRRLAKVPEDRARVEAWQNHNDMLRTAFGGVEREPLPATLDLSSRPRLRCVSNEQAPISAVPATRPWPLRRRLVAGLVSVITASAGVVFYLISINAPEAPAVDLRFRGSVDEALRVRAIAALGEAPKTQVGLPTLAIPDLETAGFVLVGAETRSTLPASLLFRYRNAAAETLVISVARTKLAPFQPPVRAGEVFLWHSRENAFALAGSVKPDRLRAIATSLQSDDSP